MGKNIKKLKEFIAQKNKKKKRKMKRRMKRTQKNKAKDEKLNASHIVENVASEQGKLEALRPSVIVCSPIAFDKIITPNNSCKRSLEESDFNKSEKRDDLHKFEFSTIYPDEEIFSKETLQLITSCQTKNSLQCTNKRKDSLERKTKFEFSLSNISSSTAGYSDNFINFDATNYLYEDTKVSERPNQVKQRGNSYSSMLKFLLNNSILKRTSNNNLSEPLSLNPLNTTGLSLVKTHEEKVSDLHQVKNSTSARSDSPILQRMIITKSINTPIMTILSLVKTHEEKVGDLHQVKNSTSARSDSPDLPRIIITKSINPPNMTTLNLVQTHEEKDSDLHQVKNSTSAQSDSLDLPRIIITKSTNPPNMTTLSLVKTHEEKVSDLHQVKNSTSARSDSPNLPLITKVNED